MQEEAPKHDSQYLEYHYNREAALKRWLTKFIESISGLIWAKWNPELPQFQNTFQGTISSKMHLLQQGLL